MREGDPELRYDLVWPNEHQPCHFIGLSIILQRRSSAYEAGITVASYVQYVEGRGLLKSRATEIFLS